MTFRILRGKHRARPLRFGFWWRKIIFTWKVSFNESCKYNLNSPDQYDCNKLVGVGYLPGHHKDSARFGWWYNTDTGLIEIVAYCYVGGQRVIQPLASIEIRKEYRIELYCLKNSYHFNCFEAEAMKPINTVDIAHGHSKNFRYRLGTYFGGNQKAPHEIKIELKKLG